MKNRKVRMSINRKILIVAALFLLSFPTGLGFGARQFVADEYEVEEPVSIDTESVEMEDTTGVVLQVPEYQDWSEVSISGKLKMKGLPLSPTLKIFMQKDSSVSISVRAPFFGEVGRLEINPEEFLVINKMKKTYSHESLSDFLRYFPGTIRDVQELILGRIVLPGFGALSGENAELVDVIDYGDGLYLVPDETIELEGADYGYMIDEQFMPLLLLIIPKERDDLSITLTYDFEKNGYSFSFAYNYDNRNLNATLELDNPRWGGEPMSPVKIDGKYTQLPLLDFMKSF